MMNGTDLEQMEDDYTEIAAGYLARAEAAERELSYCKMGQTEYDAIHRAEAAEAALAEERKGRALLAKATDRINELEAALLRDTKRQPDALAIMRNNGFVIDDLGDRWQKLAFTFYSMLSTVTEDARAVLAESDAPEPPSDAETQG